MTWHPDDVNQVTSGTCNTCIQTEYKFTGIASHASGSPEFGRSALDAVELMNVGVQFLREHMPQEARIHYAITDAGGNSPERSTAARTGFVHGAFPACQGCSCPAGASGQDCAGRCHDDRNHCEKRFIDGCSNTVPNKVLEQLFVQKLFRNRRSAAHRAGNRLCTADYRIL